MKKKNFKNLKLNKKAISSLSTTSLNGGAFDISQLIGCVTGRCPIDLESEGSWIQCECGM